MSKYRINWPIFIIGNAFGLIETAHFGWNVTPSSPAEVLADGIALLICAMAIERKP